MSNQATTNSKDVDKLILIPFTPKKYLKCESLGGSWSYNNGFNLLELDPRSYLPADSLETQGKMAYPEMQQHFAGTQVLSSPSSVTSSITIGVTTEKVFHPARNGTDVQLKDPVSVDHSARNWRLSQKVAVSVGAIVCFLVM